MIGGRWPRGGGITPDECIESIETIRIVKQLVKKIPRRYAIVLNLRFGLDGNEPKTLKEIGLALGGVGQERIRRIQLKALRLLRDELVNASTTLERILSDGGSPQ